MSVVKWRDVAKNLWTSSCRAYKKRNKYRSPSGSRLTSISCFMLLLWKSNNSLGIQSVSGRRFRSFCRSTHRRIKEHKYSKIALVCCVSSFRHHFDEDSSTFWSFRDQVMSIDNEPSANNQVGSLSLRNWIFICLICYATPLRYVSWINHSK